MENNLMIRIEELCETALKLKNVTSLVLMFVESDVSTVDKSINEIIDRTIDVIENINSTAFNGSAIPIINNEVKKIIELSKKPKSDFRASEFFLNRHRHLMNSIMSFYHVGIALKTIQQIIDISIGPNLSIATDLFRDTLNQAHNIVVAIKSAYNTLFVVDKSPDKYANDGKYADVGALRRSLEPFILAKANANDALMKTNFNLKQISALSAEAAAIVDHSIKLIELYTILDNENKFRIHKGETSAASASTEMKYLKYKSKYLALKMRLNH